MQPNGVVSNGGFDTNTNPLSSKKSRESERRRRRRKQKKTKASLPADSTAGDDSDATAEEDSKENNDPQVLPRTLALSVLFFLLFCWFVDI